MVFNSIYKTKAIIVVLKSHSCNNYTHLSVNCTIALFLLNLNETYIDTSYYLFHFYLHHFATSSQALPRKIGRLGYVI